MIIYLLKFIGCSGLLHLFYYAALQNDRLFRFNRFFLLGILVLSIVIPITIVRTQIIEVPVYSETEYAPTQAPMIDQALLTKPQGTYETVGEPILNWEQIFMALYTLVSATLLFRFARNLRSILVLKKNSKVVVVKGISIVLRTDIKASFSFLNHMYTNQTRYEQGRLPSEIVEHEKHHIKQKHSYDIILIELLQCLFWFNPFIYPIKAAIKLNHEFLADQHVLKDNPSVYNYQKILLDITRNQVVNTPVFASNLNYGFTKKRLNMMTKNTNRFKSMAKQIAAAGIIAGAFSIGGETRLIAQEVDLSPNKDLNMEIDLDRKLMTNVSMNLSPNLELEVQDTLKKKKPTQQLLPPPPIKLDKVRFKDVNGRIVEKRFSELSDSEKERFMDKTSDPEFYMPPPPPSYIDEEMLEDFQDAKKYGVWLNDKRVDNEAIKSLKVSDVHHYYKSRLFKNAINYGKHEYQLNIVTREYYKTRPESNGTWLEYIKPTRIKEKVQEQFQEKNEELEEATEVKEVPQVVEIRQAPQVTEQKEVQETDEVKTKRPRIIEIHTTKPKGEKTKEKPKNKSGQIKEKIKEKLQDLKVKKGGFNPEIHSPGIDLEKVEYFLAPTVSAHLKYTNKSGQYVIKTFGDMTDDEYSMWIHPKNNGQVFNPPKAIKPIDYSEFFALKKKQNLEFWIDGKLASSDVLDNLDYHEVYDWKMTDNKVSITSDYVFLEDDKAWISRIRYKKVE